MIVAVCADKGSPGVTTTAVALTLAWPGRAVLLEADTAGGDLAFWGRRGDGPVPEATVTAGTGPDGALLAPEPSLLSLAAAARVGLPGDALPGHAQPTRWGIDVVPAPPAAQAFAPLRPLWDGVAAACAAWPGTVIVDLGRFHSASPAAALARAATAVLVLTAMSVEGLYRARDRVGDLTRAVGDPARARTPVGVIVRTARRGAPAAERQAAAMLAAAGSPAPVLGSVWDDATAAAEIRCGTPGKRTHRGDLLASAHRLADAVRAGWPDLAEPVGHATGTLDAPSHDAPAEQARAGAVR